MPPNNSLSVWGNEKTMNLNTLVLTNIQSSPYFKVNLFELKTYHEVIDEIYYKVSHLEPWEKGSRKTAGQTGMCGGVRGVGAGGIVSSAFCLLYKLFTLKLTKKQVIGLITHKDSPYIRGLGFMYIRYTQPPTDLWAWFEEYLDDDEEIDVKAGGGHLMTVGEMLRQWLVKLEWYSTLFPRIPVPIEKDIAAKLKSRPVIYHDPDPEPEHIPSNEISFGEAERRGGFRDSHGDSSRGGDHRGSRGQSPVSRRSPTNRRNQQASSPAYQRSSATRRSPPPRRTPPPPRRTPPPPRHTPPGVDHNSFERDLARERDRQRREVGPDRRRSRSRSPRDKRERSSHSRDRKEKLSHNHERKEKISGNKDREYHNSSSHKHSYKDREHQNSSTHKHSHKDKERYEREEKSHKHKNRDKLYR